MTKHHPHPLKKKTSGLLAVDLLRQVLVSSGDYR
jgi:hypothetical protein